MCFQGEKEVLLVTTENGVHDHDCWHLSADQEKKCSKASLHRGMGGKEIQFRFNENSHFLKHRPHFHLSHTF